jgi:hypothetical protein
MAKTEVKTTTEKTGLQKIQGTYNKQLTQALSFQVQSVEDYEHGQDLLKVFSEASKKAKEEKDKVLAPAELTVKRIKEQWKPFEDGIENSVSFIKSAMSNWLQLKEEVEEKERQRLLSDKRIKNGATLQTKLASIASKPVGGTRSMLVLIVDDPNLIPREYLTVDKVKLKAALKEGIQIPGARLEREKIIVTR